MTANHFLVTRDGLTLDGALYAPLVQGAGPEARNVTDTRLGMRVNVIPNPSAEVDTSGWAPYWSGGAGTLARHSINPASGAHSFRLLPNGAGTTIRMAMAATVSVEAGKTYTLQFNAKGVNGAPGGRGGQVRSVVRRRRGHHPHARHDQRFPGGVLQDFRFTHGRFHGDPGAGVRWDDVRKQ